MDDSKASEERLLPTQSTLSGWKLFKRMILVVSFLGLGSLNVLTLIDDQVHALGYRALSSILGTAVTDSVLNKLLSNSPTMRRKQDVVVATRSLKAEADAAAIHYKAFAEKHVALEKNNRETTAKHAELKALSAKRAEEVQRISRKLATRASVGAARNLTSIPGEAIPGFGIALVLGVTAWDIYDACETIKDINKLNVEFGLSEQDATKVCGMTVPSNEAVVSQIASGWQSTYQAAAASINQAGSVVTVPNLPSKVSWTDLRGAVCPVLSYSVPGC